MTDTPALSIVVDLYSEPVSYGINDLSIPSPTGGFNARMYYPSFEGTVRDVAIRPGKYPLLAFAHGDRRGDSSLCPRDRTRDHQRWTSVLHLLAKCGYVVIAPAVADTIHSIESTAARLETAVRWIRGSWVHRGSLFTPPVVQPVSHLITSEVGERARVDVHRSFGTAEDRAVVPGWPRGEPIEGTPTPLGVVGHSWGARAAAALAVRGEVPVAAIASIAGSWDDDSAVRALRGARKPTLMIVGSADELNASSLKGIWPVLAAPKYQAMLQHAAHWDWLTGTEAIKACDGSSSPCRLGARTAAELLLGFARKHLSGVWYHPPFLLGPAGWRTPLIPAFTANSKCALQVRWDDPVAPLANQTWPRRGERIYGTWTSTTDPW